MKRLWIKVFFILTLFFYLTGCASNGKVSLKFKVLPLEQYDIDEDESKIKDRIVVSVSNKDYTLNELEDIGASVTGLDFTSKGKHTLYITYGGQTISYDYEVVGDTIITSFTKVASAIDLDDHSDGYVFGFNYKTGSIGLYDKDTSKLFGTQTKASQDVYFVATQESDFNTESLNSYIIYDEITLSDTLVFTNPVDLIATKSSNYIRGDVELVSNEEVDVKIDTDIYGSLTINTPNGHIEHYGQASEVIVESVSENTYVENGVVSKLTCSAPDIEETDPTNGNIVIGKQGIVYELDTTDFSDENTITNNGIIYNVTGEHQIKRGSNSFIFEYDVEFANSGDYLNVGKSIKLPYIGSVTVNRYRIISATFDVNSAEQLMYFSYLTQSGESPLIKDSPIVTLNITADIDMKDYEWIPIANWNYWANGVACRWYDKGNYNNGWEAFANATDRLDYNYDFVSTDEMYTRAFYNDNYSYDSKKIAPIYYIRLQIDGTKDTEGNAYTISNLNNAFLGCISYESRVTNLNLNYNADKGSDETEGQQNLIWNNVNGINVRGFLDTEINTHFGLLCNNLYIPQNESGSPMGSIEFSNITLGGTFIYRNCETTTTGDGNFVAGAFVGCAAGKGSTSETIIKFNDCAIDDELEFLITKRNANGEFVSQWGSKTVSYDDKADSCNYALLADYCCGSDSNSSKVYCNMESDTKLMDSIGAKPIKSVSNSQSSFIATDSKLPAHTCEYEKVTVREANCKHKEIYQYVCKTCGCIKSGSYTISTKTDLGEHKYGNLVSKVEATCTEDGCEAHYHCSVCGDYFDSDKNSTKLSQLKISATGHSFIKAGYKIVSDLSNLTAGDKIIITCGYTKTIGLSIYENENSKTARNAVEYTIENDYIQLNNNFEVFTLEKCTIEGYESCYYLKTSDGKYVVASGYSGNLNTQNSTSLNTSWYITKDSENNNVTILAAGSSDYKYISYLKSSETFATTKTANSYNIYIYKYYDNDYHPELTESTCTEYAHNGYYYCEDCKKYFDINNNEITEVFTSNEYASHTYKGTITKYPTSEETGTISYCCTECGHEESSKEITYIEVDDISSKESNAETFYIVKGVVVGLSALKSGNELLIKDFDSDTVIGICDVGSSVVGAISSPSLDTNKINIGDVIEIPCAIVNINDENTNNVKKALYSHVGDCGLTWGTYNEETNPTSIIKDHVDNVSFENTEASLIIDSQEDIKNFIESSNISSYSYQLIELSGVMYMAYASSAKDVVYVWFDNTLTTKASIGGTVGSKTPALAFNKYSIESLTGQTCDKLFNSEVEISTSLTSPTKIYGSIKAILAGGNTYYTFLDVLNSSYVKLEESYIEVVYPTTTEYITGTNSLDLTNGKIWTRYASYMNTDDTSTDITTAMCSGYDLSKAGKQTVTIKQDNNVLGSYKILVSKSGHSFYLPSNTGCNKYFLATADYEFKAGDEIIFVAQNKDGNYVANTIGKSGTDAGTLVNIDEDGFIYDESDSFEKLILTEQSKYNTGFILVYTSKFKDNSNYINKAVYAASATTGLGNTKNYLSTSATTTNVFDLIIDENNFATIKNKQSTTIYIGYSETDSTFYRTSTEVSNIQIYVKSTVESFEIDFDQTQDVYYCSHCNKWFKLNDDSEIVEVTLNRVFKKISSDSEIEVGNKIILVGTDGSDYYSVSKTNDNTGSLKIDIDNNLISYNNNLVIFDVYSPRSGSTTNTYTFYVNDYYLMSSTSEATEKLIPLNYNNSDLNAKGSTFTLTVDEGECSLVALANKSKNIIFNTNEKRFVLSQTSGTFEIYRMIYTITEVTE